MNCKLDHSFLHFGGCLDYVKVFVGQAEHLGASWGSRLVLSTNPDFHLKRNTLSAVR